MDSKEYWSKRFEQLEDATNTSSVAKYYDIEKLIDKSQRQIESKINSWYGRYARNNGITIEQARKELNYSELEELRWSVEEYIEKGRENAIDGRWMRQLENASSKFHINRLEAIKMQIQAESELLFGDITDEIDTHIKSQYIDRYYRSAFEIQRGTGIGSSMSAIDEKALEKIVTRPWSVDGKNFVTRVGESKVQLINNINNALTQMCLTGNNPDKAISLLASTMRGNKARAKRIILTESAFFASESQKESFKELGVKEYEVVATLDTKTSEICQEMDGKHYPMKDFQSGITAPPFHPNCRSTTCPYFNDEFTQDLKRTARDKGGDNYKVPMNTTYSEWKENFVNQEKPSKKFTDTDVSKLSELRKKYKSLENAMLFGSADDATEFKRLLNLEKESTKPSEYDKLFNQQKYTEKEVISWRKTPSKLQEEAISTYTGSAYTRFNDYYRNAGYVTPIEKNQIEVLHNYLNSQKTPKTIYLKRGYSTGNVEKHLGEFKNGDVRSIIGSTITDKGFVSTTSFEGGGFGGNVIMYIKAPAGTRGAYVSDLSHADNEKEFLLDCNQKFIIKDARKVINEYGIEVVEVFCEVIT